MGKKTLTQPQWLDDVEAHNYPAAQSYLSLIFSARKAGRLTAELRAAAVIQFKAKDIFRASKLSLLGISNLHVDRDKKKIADGLALSPILLVRQPRSASVIVADGYHRMCAVYAHNEDSIIPCKIV
ncbi:MAG: hypothetical protein ACOH1V_03970 [Stenotrophomonas sp.]